MEPSIRPARIDDLAAIAAFTSETFEWGDYVADALADWLDDPNGHVVVATDDSDEPIALGRGAMLSDTELWLQGARVRQDWRRRGLATAVGRALMQWGRKRGALVARLAIETWNEPARNQVETAGFRPVGDWIVAVRSAPMDEPESSSNGGKRAAARRRLERSHSSEAIPAWLSWRSGPLLRPTRGLQSWRWRWARLEFDQLVAGAKRGELWSSQAGWALARRDGERLAVGWLECGPDDALDMLRSLVDLTETTESERLHIAVPAVDWLIGALEATQCDLHPIVIYEFSL
ncbi:MAG: GNAT family N-acetyltransferase [Acidimicrobiia bacterium]|nr:GNAT family N-acetyltransferase [Acidimicrobiia bacterium]